MLRTVKPRNARSKRALEKRAPKAVENPKTALFLRGTTRSQVVHDALDDLYQLRRPLAKKFSKRNDVHPFDGPGSQSAQSLEFFSQKNDASLLVFGCHTKKRPQSLTLIRTFDHKILDMLELHLDQETYRRLDDFKGGRKPALGLRPMVLFAGDAWEGTVGGSGNITGAPDDAMTLARSLFTDFFASRDPLEKVDVEGLQYIVTLTAVASPSSRETGDARLPTIHLRAYLIRTLRSGQKLPRVEVDEMGPRMDFRVGRSQLADDSAMKAALKRVRSSNEEKTKKNVATDAIGHQVGRIHLGRQDLGKMQMKKTKALRKRGRSDEEEDGHEDVFEGLSEDDGQRKKAKTA